MLPHYEQSKNGSDLTEPMYKNQFANKQFLEPVFANLFQVNTNSALINEMVQSYKIKGNEIEIKFAINEGLIGKIIKDMRILCIFKIDFLSRTGKVSETLDLKLNFKELTLGGDYASGDIISITGTYHIKNTNW